MPTGATGLEPATSGVTGRRSNQLSYAPRARGNSSALPPGPSRGVPAREPQLGGSSRFHGGVNRFEPGGRAMSNVVAKRSMLPLAMAIAIGLTGTAQAKQIDGTPGNDAIRGSRQADVINGLAGDDRIGAGRGADVVSGNEGNDRIWGGRGFDQLHGNLGDDRVWGGDGNDTDFGEDGNDLMGGGTGADKQYGGPGNDTIYAGRGQDESWGEAGRRHAVGARAQGRARTQRHPGRRAARRRGQRHVQDARRRGGRDRLRAGRGHGAAGLQGRDQRRDGAEPERLAARSSTGSRGPRRARTRREDSTPSDADATSAGRDARRLIR